MTAIEMQYEAKIIYESIASADAPGYTDRQWSIILTQAQEKVVLEICNDGLDKNESNRRVVRNLHKTVEIDGDKIYEDVLFGYYHVIFPSDFLHPLKEVANYSARVKAVSYDFVESNKKNPFEKPSKDIFWKLFHSEGATIVTNGQQLLFYTMDYISKPKPIITKDLPTGAAIEGFTDRRDCELDESVHRIIVDRAGKLAFAYTENPQMYQIQSLEENSIK
jgi:hypothetical protein